MPKLRQQFIVSTVENLEILRQKISTAKDFPDSSVQEIFRQIHTVKGTAQTFGFEKSSRIAHELENTLSDLKNRQNKLSKKILLESITALKKSFDENNSESADHFIEKLKIAASSKQNLARILPELPEGILNLLSESEINALSTAFGNGKLISCLEVYFALANLREKMLEFRAALEQSGEIIATLSAAKKDSQIGFRFLFAGKTVIKEIDNIKKISPEIIFQISPVGENLLQVLREVTNGEGFVKQSGKKIEFEISVAELFLSNSQTKTIFDALLHIIRNAVDHAIEIPAQRIEKNKSESGKIEIRLLRENENLKIIVSDDGKGIDSEKIKSIAAEKRLISENEDLGEQEVLNLIFHPGFSTVRNLTEISGRGVGLDAVKTQIEGVGGKITVRKRKKNGTTFEIFLPPEN